MAEEMTVRDASYYSKLSPSYIIQLIKRGEIKGRKIGIWLVEKESLDSWLKRRKQKQGTA